MTATPTMGAPRRPATAVGTALSAVCAILILLAGCANEVPVEPDRSGVGRSAAAAADRAAPDTANAPSAPDVPISEETLECLAQTMYWEAGADPRNQAAVGHVVLNRVASPRFPDTVCGVVHQGGATPLYSCQFHWWCDGRSDDDVFAPAYATAQATARELLTDPGPDPTDGALFFHATSISPGWFGTLERTASMGGHIFYR